MTLKTGQALLFSPASLFVSNKGTLATLSTGYAIIKSRPRLTADGGESLLATQPTQKSVKASGLVTPETDSPHESPTLGVRIPHSGTTQQSSVTSYINSVSPNCPVVVSSGVPSPASTRRDTSPPPLTQAAKLETQSSSVTSSTQAEPPQARAHSPFSVILQLPSLVHDHSQLIAAMRKLEQLRKERELPIAALSRDSMACGLHLMAGCNDFKSYLERAAKDGVVVLRSGGNVELSPSHSSLPTAPAPPPIKAASVRPPTKVAPPVNAVPVTPPTKAVPPIKTILVTPPTKTASSTQSNAAPSTFSPLIQVINSLDLSAGIGFHDVSLIASSLLNYKPPPYTRGSKGSLTKYLEDARSAGIVQFHAAGSTKVASLTPQYRNGAPTTARNASKSTDPRFQTLVSVMKALSPNRDYVLQSKLAPELAKQKSGGFVSAGFKRLTEFLVAAEESGVINRRGSNGKEELRLQL
ncbi:hypothetical protein FRC17_000248 [Serendipita sp. 399]|nr:hypothetical protein FRC17_000248 [Serendipita sp. 399]